jgi:hypothetical protein
MNNNTNHHEENENENADWDNWELLELERKLEPRFEKISHEIASCRADALEAIEKLLNIVFIILLAAGFAYAVSGMLKHYQDVAKSQNYGQSQESSASTISEIFKEASVEKPMSENRRLGLEVQAELMQDCVSFLAAQKYAGTANLTIQQCQTEGRNFMDRVRAYTASQSKPATDK